MPGSIIVALLLAATSVQANPEFWVHEWPQTNFQKTRTDLLGHTFVYSQREV